MKLKDILQMQSILEKRATPYDILENNFTHYSKSKDEYIELLDLHLIHFIRIFLNQVEEYNNGTKRERLEEIQYSLNQILEDVRELKDE